MINFVVERRKCFGTVEDSNCFLGSSLDSAVDWISRNLDYDGHDFHWWWVIIKIEADNEDGGELLKIFDWNGNELKNQPILNKPPPPPLSRIIREGNTGSRCAICGSTMTRSGFFHIFGERYCNNNLCPNSK